LPLESLKNVDAARAAALREVARRLDCEIFLAPADVHEAWSCVEEDPGYSLYGNHRRRHWRHDEEKQPVGERSDTPALTELFDSEVELRHWIGLGVRPEEIASAVDPQRTVLHEGLRGAGTLCVRA
jgi:hypothetical protein